MASWLQWIGQRQQQDETGSIYVLGFGSTYIRGLTVQFMCNMPGASAFTNSLKRVLMMPTLSSLVETGLSLRQPPLSRQQNWRKENFRFFSSCSRIVPLNQLISCYQSWEATLCYTKQICYFFLSFSYTAFWRRFVIFCFVCTPSRCATRQLKFNQSNHRSRRMRRQTGW